MDVQMPVMNGIEATQQIRMLPGYENIPIIGVTAGNVLGEKEKCLESGMTDFLPKPLRQADLMEMLKKYISVNRSNDKNGDTGHREDQSDMKMEKYIDMNMLNEQIGDDGDFKDIFINLLIQELTMAEKNIEKAAEEKNNEEMKTILHKHKGTAGSAGLFKLSECALKWEKITEHEMDFSLMSNEIKQQIKTALKIVKDLMKRSV